MCGERIGDEEGMVRRRLQKLKLMDRQRAPKYAKGHRVGHYTIVKRLGLGPHAEVYLVTHGERNTHYAVKIEDPIATLKKEADVLKAFAKQPLRFSAGFIEFRPQSKVGAYLVMELLGEDMSCYRKRQKHAALPMKDVSEMSIQMLRALQSFHSAGYVHRDVGKVL